jgi:hypothetical protein
MIAVVRANNRSRGISRWLVRAGLALCVLLAGGGQPVFAQSQAINGTIEGVASDASGAVLPGVTVTIVNVGTGTTRAVVTNERGEYRAALLPLGEYRVRAELQGFKTVERSGLQLSAGQTAVANFRLEVGGIEEVVSVTGATPVADPARIDLGRTIGTTEVQNLPSVARNAYNFALLQPNVTGYDNEEFGATRVNANGTQMRTNYQIDGSSATQKNRAGLRMFQPTDIMIQEVKVITSGFAPEFGQTTGMVFNTITPSGTNQFSGQGSYRFRRKGYSAKPKNVVVFSPATNKPDTKVDDVAGTFGGPIVRDKVFFFTGYEWVKKDLSADRVITVTPETAQVLGLSADALGDGVIPAIQTVNVFIAKVDAQLNAANRLSGRWSVFNNVTPENITGGLNTRENSVDFQDRMDSVSVQLASTLGNTRLNELRIAYGRRNNPQSPSDAAGPGPIIQVQGVANFGGAPPPAGSPTPFEFEESYWQIVDNFSWMLGAHSLKAGLDFQFIDDYRLNDLVPQYIFPTTAAYLAAKNGVNPYSYSTFRQGLGDPTISYSQSYYSFFVQDDWRITPSFKLLYGLRYDLFKVPDASPDAPYPPSRDFRIDGDNFAPRAGFAWSIGGDGRTVLRASTGIMYEPPLGDFYQDALQESGSPLLYTVSLAGTSSGAPAFPGTLSSLPPGVTPSRSIRAVASDFNTQYAWLSNVQIEHALTSDLSVALAYVNSTGRSLPLLYNSNCVNSGTALPDGRPICANPARVDPNFDRIFEIRSTADAQYNALTATVNKRMSGGWLVQAAYTLAKAEDNGVIGSRYVVGSTDPPSISDPFDQERDYNYTSWNTTHTFSLSTVWNTSSKGDGLWSAIANNNQFSFVLLANSGLPFNILSNRDLNLDGLNSDRPNGVPRNSGELGTYVNVDARYSRFIPISGRMRGEVFVEARNLFNTFNVRAVNNVVATDTLGDPITTLPTEPCTENGQTGCFPLTQTYDARQAQIGFKFLF